MNNKFAYHLIGINKKTGSYISTDIKMELQNDAIDFWAGSLLALYDQYQVQESILPTKNKMYLVEYYNGKQTGYEYNRKQFIKHIAELKADPNYVNNNFVICDHCGCNSTPDKVFPCYHNVSGDFCRPCNTKFYAAMDKAADEFKKGEK